MSDKKPISNPGQGGKPKTLLCEQWEALLVDALDGTLSATDSAAFYAHRETCMACAQLLEESKRGSEWLHFLETEPEVPADLISKILAKTSGAEDTQPVIAPAGMPLAVPAAAGWTANWSGGWLPVMEKHAAQSRWIMTAAMAFFSIAFTLNMTGVKLSGFRLADLKPTTLASGVKSQYYVATRSVSRYYDNLRFVYELESRVREMRRDTAPEPTQQKPATGGNKNSNDAKPATKHTGGSARAPEPDAEPAGHAEPILARWEQERPARSVVRVGELRKGMVCALMDGADRNDRFFLSVKNSGGTNRGTTNGDRKYEDDKRSEGSLA